MVDLWLLIGHDTWRRVCFVQAETLDHLSRPDGVAAVGAIHFTLNITPTEMISFTKSYLLESPVESKGTAGIDDRRVVSLLDLGVQEVSRKLLKFPLLSVLSDDRIS